VDTLTWAQAAAQLKNDSKERPGKTSPKPSPKPSPKTSPRSLKRSPKRSLTSKTDALVLEMKEIAELASTDQQEFLRKFKEFSLKFGEDRRTKDATNTPSLLPAVKPKSDQTDD